ncbi:MAG TPA: hypothetical protein VHZ24_22820 [Pirellulales bacterium]|jgi:ferric-dicitrate binding protein FerR (iron transport regulator)|nr:hypothetical protein [Pirellulales bacterium]
MNRPADSPWFWVLIFGAAALVALAAIAPKHQQRQARLERMAQQRERQQFGENAAPIETAEPTENSLRPLFLTLAAILAIAAIVLAARRTGTTTRPPE